MIPFHTKFVLNTKVRYHVSKNQLLDPSWTKQMQFWRTRNLFLRNILVLLYLYIYKSSFLKSFVHLLFSNYYFVWPSPLYILHVTSVSQSFTWINLLVTREHEENKSYSPNVLFSNTFKHAMLRRIINNYICCYRSRIVLKGTFVPMTGDVRGGWGMFGS